MDNEGRQPDGQKGAQNEERRKAGVLKPGESFGNYRVVRCLSVGLIAHYYQMQHVRDLQEVTVGVFHKRGAQDSRLLLRLEGLQRATASLEHESIPKITGVTKVDGRPCLFLDPVKGQTLSGYFEAHGVAGQSGVGVEIATRIIAQLHGALGYAHSQGVDHRDLVSDLIFVQADGSIRLLGLGVKEAIGVELFESIVSASVSPLVSDKTPGHLNSFDTMSPEYRSGLPEDARTDVYAIGFIGYWLLTGRKPDTAQYEPPTKLIDDIYPSWDAFFLKSLERSVDHRFQSCKSALLALKATNEEPQSEGAGFVQRQIDRIPVPRGIVERGLLATRIYRLFIIGLVGLTLTAIAASFLTVAYRKAPEDTRVVAKLLASPEGAALQLKLRPPVARVEFLGYGQRFIADDGWLYLAVKPGDHKLRVTSPNHIEQVIKLEILANADAPKLLSVELEPAWIALRVQTTPAAAVAVIDADGLESELGVADAEGVFYMEKGLYAGTYTMVIEKEDYRSATLDDLALEVGEVTEVDAPLQPLPAALAIVTRPSGATIELNQKRVGTSPLMLEDVSPNESYLVVARLDGYRPVARRLEVKPAADLEIDFGDLVPLSGSLDIQVEVGGARAPAASTLYDELAVVIDGESTAYGDAALGFVPVGEHRIHLEHPLYRSEVTTLEVEDKERYELTFLLKPRPGEVKLVFPESLHAKVRLNGSLVEAEGGVVQVPAYEAIELELRIRDYLTMTRRFELEPNAVEIWEVEPVPIPGPTKGEGWSMPYISIPFAWIPPGSYEMGSPSLEHARLPNEGPQTEVRFSAGFWAGVYEVTQAQYSEIMGQNPSTFINPGRPVEGVLWAEARGFCESLTRIEREAGRLPEGYVYRLPTEAEWEYAARAGTVTAFHFGNEADASMGHFRGVYPRDRAEGLRSPEGAYGTAPVGLYSANAFGLYDMHGNVREWTLDAYNGRLDGVPQVDPKPRMDGERMTLRGGGWGDNAARVRSAARDQTNRDVRSDAIGFRVLLAPEL